MRGRGGVHKKSAAFYRKRLECHNQREHTGRKRTPAEQKKRTRRPVNDYCDAMYFKETKEKVCAPMLIASLVKLPLAEFAIRLRDSSRGGSFLAN